MKKSVKNILILVIVLMGIISLQIIAGANSGLIDNKFTKGFEGYTSDEGEILTSDYISSKEIAVKEGQTVWFGPCHETQYFHLIGLDSNGKAVTDKIRGKELDIEDTFNNGMVIYKYNVPKGIAKLIFTASSEVADVYAVSDAKFDCVKWYAHWSEKNVNLEDYVPQTGICNSEKGKYIYFGALTKGDALNAVTYDKDLKKTANISESNLELIQSLDGEYGIYCYTVVDKDIRYVRLPSNSNSSYGYTYTQSKDALSNDKVVAYFKNAFEEIIYTNEGYNFSEGLEWQTTKEVNQKIRSVEAWVKVPKTTRDDRVLTIVSGNADVTFKLDVCTEGRPRLYYPNVDGTSTNYIADVDVRTNKWTHIAWTWDTEFGTVQCYINGESVYTNYGIGDAGETSTLYVGRTSNSGWNYPFLGEIADLRVWSECLTADDVQYNMKTVDIGSKDGLLLNLPLDEDTETDSLRDISSNNNAVEVYVKLRWIDVNKKPSDYSIAIIPDQQILTNNYPDKLYGIYDWLASIADTENLQMVLNVGDITDNNTTRNWEHSLEAYNRIKGVTPYICAPGNHDYSYDFSVKYRNATNMNKYFPLSMFEGMTTSEGVSTFGGAYEANAIENTWQEFTVCGHKYLVLALELFPRDSVLTWASEVVSSHPEHQVIVLTHGYDTGLGTLINSVDYSFIDEGNSGRQLWDKFVSQHTNIIMVICGHTSNNGTGNIRYTVATGKNGNEVKQFMINSQDIDAEFEGGIGMVAMMNFSNNGQTVELTYYCPSEGKYLNPENQFTFNLPAPSDVKNN